MFDTEPPILYFARVLPDYRATVLERLQERAGRRVIACFGDPPAGSSVSTLSAHDRLSIIEHVHCRNFWLLGEHLHFQLTGAAFRKYSAPSTLIIEESPRSLHLPFLLTKARKEGVPTLLWGHFSSNNRLFSPERNLTDRYRIHLARTADGVICYTAEIAAMLSPYIPERQRFVAVNTMDTETLFRLVGNLDREGREGVRQRLGLPTSVPVVASVGRLLRQKGVDVTLKVFADIRREQDARLLIIGDGPERRALEEAASQSGLKNDVQFLGAISSLEDSAAYLYAADVLLNPGQAGLSINHALALGLPVVTRRSPGAYRYHGPEISYLEHGKNAMLAKWDDVEDLRDCVLHVIRNRAEYSRNALDYARSHLTIDNMVEGLAEAVAFAESLRR